MKAVFGKLVYDGLGSALKSRYVVFDKGRVTSVQEEKPECDVVLECGCITPGFVDAHSHIGLDRYGEGASEDDTNEKMDSLLFTLRAFDGLVYDDRGIREAFENGVLYSCVLHGSGNIIGGKSAIIRMFSDSKKDAFVRDGGIKCALGYNPKSTDEWKGTRPSTRMGVVSILRNKLIQARNLKSLLDKGKKEVEELDPEEQEAIRLLDGTSHLRVHLHREDDLYSLLSLIDEFGIRAVVDHGCAFYRMTPFVELKDRGIPLVYGPLDSFPYKVELKGESYRNVRFALESGVRFAIMSDHPVVLARNTYLQLRLLLRFGVSKADAVKHLTSIPADIIGLDGAGRLTAGSLASFVCWSGDPFDLSSYPEFAVAEGKEFKFQH